VVEGLIDDLVVGQSNTTSPLPASKVQFAHRISLELRSNGNLVRNVPVMISETDLLKLPARGDDKSDAQFWAAFALMGAEQIEDHVWRGDEPAVRPAVFPPAQQAFVS
jgi:hypothetical protein